MKIAKARELSRLNIGEMNLEQVQKHKVRLLDAWRESKAFYGFEQAVRDWFYKVVVDSAASGYFPTDMLLTKTLRERIDQADAREKYLFEQGE